MNEGQFINLATKTVSYPKRGYSVHWPYFKLVFDLIFPIVPVIPNKNLFCTKLVI